MKRIIIRIVFSLLFFSIISIINAQVPSGFKYQAILRDVNGAIITTQTTITIKITGGNSSFTENHTITPNSQGLINFVIGSVNTTDFDAIDWTTGSYSIEIFIGNDFLGASPILTVPYAIHSKTVENENDPLFSQNFNLTGTTNGDLLKFDGSKFVKFSPDYLTSYTETDPLYTAWDKSTGITITKNQISDFGDYLTNYTETDPIFSSSINVSGSVTGDLLKFDGSKYVKFTPDYLTDFTETDPLFKAWDKSTGITITKSQISDFGDYLTSYTETDPLFSSSINVSGSATGDLLKFDGSKYVKFTPNYLTDFTESDPLFKAWDKSTGIIITKSQISDFGNYLTSFTETDPLFAAKFDVNGSVNGDLLKFDGSKFVKFTPNYLTSFSETDPLFTAKFDLSGSANGDLLKFDGTKFVRFTPDYATVSHTHSVATIATNGFMSNSDKIKLDGLVSANGSETKITAGTNISITGNGTSSTPYVISSQGFTHYLGEEYLDGIIYYLYIGSDGQQHGLIVSKTESTAIWGGSTLVGADRTDDGVYNTSKMPNDPGTARNWVVSLGAGWYVPSLDELFLLYNGRLHVNKTARAKGYTIMTNASKYLSSTESTDVDYFITDNLLSNWALKTETWKVRGIKAF